MLSRAPLLRRLIPAVTYAAIFAVACRTLATQSAVRQTYWLEWASTNLANMGTHPVVAMVVSAFLAQGAVTLWVVLALVGIGVTGLALGAWRAVAIITCAHVLGTLISEGVLWFQVRAGAVPVSQERILDIGPSYVVVGALVAGIVCAGRNRDITEQAAARRPATVSGPDSDGGLSRRVGWHVSSRHSGRIACAIGFAVIAPDCFQGLAQLDVAAMGHTCAAVIGIGLGWLLQRDLRDLKN